MNKPCSWLKSDRRRLLCHNNLLQPHRLLNGRHQNPCQIRITPNHPVFVMLRLLVQDLPKQFMMIPFLHSPVLQFHPVLHHRNKLVNPTVTTNFTTTTQATAVCSSTWVTSTPVSGCTKCAEKSRTNRSLKKSNCRLRRKVNELKQDIKLLKTVS